MVVLIIDIDFFKKVNDSVDHVQGDNVLKCCAKILQSGMRLPDIVARCGGEEFVIWLPDISLPEVFKLADRLRLQIADDARLNPLTDHGITINTGLYPFDETHDMDWHS